MPVNIFIEFEPILSIYLMYFNILTSLQGHTELDLKILSIKTEILFSCKTYCNNLFIIVIIIIIYNFKKYFFYSYKWSLSFI